MRVGRVDKHIAVVTLDRPEKLNALDMAAFRGVRDAALKLRDDASVRCVVLRGAGRAFCAGLDVKGVMHPLRERTAPSCSNVRTARRRTGAGRVLPLARRAVPRCRRSPRRVLRRRPADRAGADVRVAAEDAKLSVMEAKWGLVPDAGATMRCAS